MTRRRKLKDNSNAPRSSPGVLAPMGPASYRLQGHASCGASPVAPLGMILEIAGVASPSTSHTVGALSWLM